MAANVPAALKAADINRFATRAAQVEQAKPAVAFWSYYWIVQSIITKALQNSDDECRTYTAGIMDKLEAAKAERPDDEAITDDVAGKIYVEEFGLEVFHRADNAVRANKASRQTADTFLAAATFLDLLQIWPPLDGEVAAKIKFAKYHALRIAKAIKAGEDPNLSNPKSDLEPTHEQTDLASPSLGPPGGFQQASVEEVPDEHHRPGSSIAQPINVDDALRPNSAPLLPQRPPVDVSSAAGMSSGAENFYQSAPNGDVSPLGPPSAGPALSEGGGYFPRVPGSDAVSPQGPLIAPPNNTGAFGSTPVPPSSQYPAAPPSASQPSHFPPNIPPQSPQIPQHYQPSHSPGPYANAYQQPYQSSAAMPPPSAQPMQAPGSTEFSEEVIAKASKHARWAISALNFDDVPTAIDELRGALKTLGAR